MAFYRVHIRIRLRGIASERSDMYYDIHMVVHGDSKEGYSVFVEASSENEAVEIMTNNHLYEEPEDLSNIDYVGEISEEEYRAATS